MLNWIVKGLLQWLYGLIWQMGEYIMNALMDVFNMDMTYFKTAVPISETIMDIMFGVGWALLLGNLVFQAAKSMMSGMGFDGEDPRSLGFRTLVFAFLLVCSRQICEIGLGLGATVVDLLQVPSSVILPSMTEDMFSIDASWLIIIILGIIILFQLVKFFFEVGERYVIVGVLTILSPLAFAMGGSRNTMDIFKGWARMYGSMCLMLVMNVIFMKMIISAMAIFPKGLAVFPWIILIIALARVARKIDSIIARIGLNPAITGDGLGRGFPGMMALMVGKSLLSGMASGKMGSGKATAGAAKAASGAAAGAASGFKGGARPAPSPVNTGAGGGNTPPGTTNGVDSINSAPNAGTAGAPVNPPIRNAGQTSAGSASPVNANPASSSPINPPLGRTPQGTANRQTGSRPFFEHSNGGRGRTARSGIPVSADDAPAPRPAAFDGSDSKPSQASHMNAAAPVQPLDTSKTAGAATPHSTEKPSRSLHGTGKATPLDVPKSRKEQSQSGAKPAPASPTPVNPASSSRAQSQSTNTGAAGQPPVNRSGGASPVQPSQTTAQGAQVNAPVSQGGAQVQSHTNASQQGAQVQQSTQQNTQNQLRTAGNAAPQPIPAQAAGSAPVGKAPPASQQQSASAPSPVATQAGKSAISAAPSPKAATQAGKAASKAQGAKTAPKSTPGTAAQTPKTPKPVDLKAQAKPPKTKQDALSVTPLKAGKKQTPTPVDIGTGADKSSDVPSEPPVEPKEPVTDHE